MRSLPPLAAALVLLLACSTEKRSKPHPFTQQAPAASATASANELRDSLKEFENRKIYLALSTDVLASIPDDKLEQAIIDFISEKAKKNGGDERKTLQNLPAGFLAVYATWVLEAEVNNGGYNQFFWNSSGEYADDAVRGFNRIGAPGLAALTAEAIEIQKKQAARTTGLKKRGTLEDFSESYQDNALNPLDDRFYKSNIDIGALRVKFIRENPKLFVAD
jgi:hypothetical protein